jgi:hypothetical protein
MPNVFVEIKDWDGWHILWAVARSVPVFFLKTKTGRSLIGAILTRSGVALSADALAVILEILFYLIVGNGIVNANEPWTIVKDIFEEELRKIKENKKDVTE